MKNIMQGVFDVVFSIPTFLIGLCVGMGLLIMAVAKSENEEKELRAKQTAYCYSIGQVLVETDAGRHCVAPESLTIIK
jgi:hypothetical protein